MKLIRAILQPHRLDDVRETLNQHGVHGMTVYEARGFGRQRGHKEIYRGAEYMVNFTPKVVLEVVVDEEHTDTVIDLIADTAKTGNIGDGKIFVMDVQEAVRIRTGERNENAL